MEEGVIREANVLIFTNVQTADRVMGNYPAEWRRKAHVIPHGYEPSAPMSGVSPAGSGILTIVHTGRFYEGIRTPEPLLHALASLAARRPLAKELHVALVGTPVPSHRRLAASLGLDGVVEFAGRVPFAESLQRAAEADVLMVIDAPAEESLFLPSKLIDYLPLARPILGLTPAAGATADVLRALGHPIVAPGDESAIAAVVERLIDAKRGGALTAPPAHQAGAAAYDIRNTTRAFDAILRQCA
jgi:glycosyltransferase involved in cell wall biosynthesis